MEFFAKIRRTLLAFGKSMLLQSKRIDRSNKRTISYIKKLRSAADGELRRIVTEEKGSFLRDNAKLRAAKFILCNRG